jgi:hypothetical protein
VPLIVIVFPDHAAVTPSGSPDALPMPVAFVVLCVIFVNAVFCIKPGLEDADPAAHGNTIGVNFWALTLEDDELPIRFLANTLKIYDTLIFKPFTVMGDFKPLVLVMEDTTKPETGSFVSSIIVSGISLLVIVLFSINIFFWE